MSDVIPSLKAAFGGAVSGQPVVAPATQKIPVLETEASERERILARVREDGLALANVPKKLKDDEEVVMAAVLQEPRALYYASERLKNDRQIVLAAVQKSGYVLYYASEEMRDDGEIVIAAIRESATAYDHASERMKNDREVALAMVQEAGTWMEYLPEKMRGDHEVILAAVKNNPRALHYASLEAKNNRELVMALVKMDWQALQYASDELRCDSEVVMAAVRQDGEAFFYAMGAADEDREIGMVAVKNDVKAFTHLSHELSNDREIVLEAVRKNGMALRHAGDKAKKDEDIVRVAVLRNWRASEYASKALKKDPDFMKFVEQEKKAQSGGKTRALNFLWINLDMTPKPDPEDGSIRMPMPEEYIENVRNAAKKHKNADIHLWVDSRRLTEKQMKYLKAVVAKERPNARVKDLCSIPQYINEELYSRTETEKDWREDYKGVVWLQVDAAKILISLQGDYDQKFFADLDHAHVDIGSAKVQKMLHKHGLMIGLAGVGDWSIENQLWGFDRSRQGLFEDYYAAGLKGSYKGEIAFEALHPILNDQLQDFESMDLDSISLEIDSIGLEHAEHPGHEWETNPTDKGKTTVSASELKQVFSKKSGKKPSAKKTKPARKKMKTPGKDA